MQVSHQHFRFTPLGREGGEGSAYAGAGVSSFTPLLDGCVQDVAFEARVVGNQLLVSFGSAVEMNGWVLAPAAAEQGEGAGAEAEAEAKEAEDAGGVSGGGGLAVDDGDVPGQLTVGGVVLQWA